MFITINIRRMWRACLRKFVITLAVLMALYLLYQWFQQPVPQPEEVPTMVLRELSEIPG